MFKRVAQLLIACFLAGAVWGATDPFVGDWKLNPSRSRIAEVMKVSPAGPNKYAFDLGGGDEIIVPDGTDQHGFAGSGTTLAVTIEAPDRWKVVRKQNGHMSVMGIWTLSKDGSPASAVVVVFAFRCCLYAVILSGARFARNRRICICSSVAV